MTHIFISYNHEDNDFAEILSHRLHDAGFTTWRDVDKLSAGEIWRVEIDQAIKNALAMIVIMTPNAKISQYVTYEWAFAWGVGVKVIPVMLKPAELHPRLEDIQYLDFTGQIRPWDKLIDAVRRTTELKNYNKNHILQKIPTFIQQAIMGLNSLKAAEREEAIQSLAKTDHPAAHEAMIEALEHPLKELRIQMGLLLAEFQEPKAVPILIDTLHNKDNDIRTNAITALTKLGLPAVTGLHNVLYDSDRTVRLAAAQALGEIGDITAIPDLLKMLRDIDEDVRVNAVEAIGKIKDNTPLQALFEILRDAKSSTRLRRAVIIALISIGNADAVPELSKCLLNDEYANIRYIAAVALGEIRNVVALPALQETLHDSDHEVRLAAASALGKIGDSSAIPALIETLQDTDIAVVDRTLGALRRIGTSEALAAIQDWQNSKNID